YNSPRSVARKDKPQRQRFAEEAAPLGGGEGRVLAQRREARGGDACLFELLGDLFAEAGRQVERAVVDDSRRFQEERYQLRVARVAPVELREARERRGD